MGIDSNKIRDMILQILIDHDRTGSAYYKDSGEIASAINVDKRLVEAHLDVLAGEGYVDLAKTFEGSSARITSKALVYHGYSTRQMLKSAKSSEAEDREKEAIRFFEEAFIILSKEDYSHNKDLQTALMKVQHALRLLNWNRQLNIVTGELIGYSSNQEVNQWRKVQKTMYYEQIGGVKIPTSLGLEEHEEDFWLYSPISELLEVILVGGYKSEDDVQFSRGKRTWTVKEIKIIQEWKLIRLLNMVRMRFYSFCSDSISQLRFGKSMESIFERYRQAVEGKLGQLGIGNHLEAVTESLSSQNPESWRAAALGCRNLLSDLARKLWQAPDSVYPYLNNMPLKGGATNLVKNKLRAWLHQKGLRRHDDLFIEKRLIQLADCLNELYALASKAKQSITYEDALSCVMNTYVLVGEIAMRTDLEPVTEIQKIEE